MNPPWSHQYPQHMDLVLQNSAVKMVKLSSSNSLVPVPTAAGWLSYSRRWCTSSGPAARRPGRLIARCPDFRHIFHGNRKDHWWYTYDKPWDFVGIVEINHENLMRNHWVRAASYPISNCSGYPLYLDDHPNVKPFVHNVWNGALLQPCFLFSSYSK